MHCSTESIFISYIFVFYIFIHWYLSVLSLFQVKWPNNTAIFLTFSSAVRIFYLQLLNFVGIFYSFKNIFCNGIRGRV
jgi:hypothetical protein